MSDDIVVVGKRNSSGILYGFSTLPPGRVYVPRMIDESGGDAEDFAEGIYVHVQLVNPANKSKAIQAAQALITKIAAAQDALSNPTTSVIVVDGVVFVVSTTLAELNRTRFIVNDSTYNNGGVGEAVYNTTIDGFNVDTINFQSILDYDNAGYIDKQGMSALLFHELGHLSQQGYDFRQSSIQEYENRHGGSTAGYVGSAIERNVESFMNDFMVSMTTAVGVNINVNGAPVLPGGYQNAVSPADVPN